ncbi:MAG: FTR1 family protein [Acidimicrobiia bacterium]|nr:FTR1 family protein [Acidimicrobiia bacterium]
MGSGLLITLREGLEIALVLAIIIAYLKKIGRTDRLGAVWVGAGAAVAVSLATGLLFNAAVGEFEGKWEQFIEGVLAFAAVGVLTWMIFWMRGHARGIASELHAKVDDALTRSFTALAVIAFVAVAREGFETVLFLLGAETSSESGAAVVTGGVVGLALAAVLGYLFYLGSDRVDLRKFFNWTGVLLILFAAGLFAKGIHEFRAFFELEAAWYAAPVWEFSSGPLAEGWTYDFLKGLFGWSRDPERIRVVAYVAYLVPVLWFFFKGAVTPSRATVTAPEVPLPVPSEV